MIINIRNTGIILTGIIMCILPSCTDNSKHKFNNKYTKSDYIYLTNVSTIMKHISEHSTVSANEFKKYPDTDFDIIYYNYQKIIDEVNKANIVNKPDNFMDTYNCCIKSLNDLKIAIEMSREGFRNKDIKVISQSNKLLESANYNMNIASEKAKYNYEELKMYYNESKMEKK